MVQKKKVFKKPYFLFPHSVLWTNNFLKLKFLYDLDLYLKVKLPYLCSGAHIFVGNEFNFVKKDRKGQWGKINGWQLKQYKYLTLKNNIFLTLKVIAI